MKLTQLLRILRAHLLLLVLTMGAVLSLAMLVTAMTPRRYMATSSILIDFKTTNPAAGSGLPAQLYAGYLTTQLDVLTSQTVALKVVDRLQLLDQENLQQRYLPSKLTPVERANNAISTVLRPVLSRLAPSDAMESADAEANKASLDKTALDPQQITRYALADRLLKQVDVKPSPDSSVIQVSYTAADPRAAAIAANALVQAYIATSLELSVNPARQSSQWYEQQIKTLSANVDAARAQLIAYQQQTGIVAADEGDDVDNSRLADLSQQLVAAQSQNHPAIQSSKDELAKAEAKLNNLPPQLGKNHPQYQSALAEVTSLRARVSSQSVQLVQGLQQQMAEQKSLLMQTNKKRAQLETLKDNVSAAQKSLDEAMQSASQVNLESQVNQTNVSVVRVATPPTKPTIPNVAFNLLLACGVGALLAIGLALWREVTCRYVRGIDDIREVLGVPVLGILHDGGRTQLQRLRLPTVAPRLVSRR